MRAITYTYEVLSSLSPYPAGQESKICPVAFPTRTLERSRDADEYERVLGDARDRVRELSETVDAMLRLARTEAGIAPGDRVTVDLYEVLTNVREFFEPVTSGGGVALVGEESPRVFVSGDASWLHQLFANLIANAIKFTPRGGRGSVEWEMQQKVLVVRVRDTGPGISAEEAPLTFERFRRGREGRRCEGYGLGLAIAREIARAHGGNVGIEAGSAGATFRVSLPVVPGPGDPLVELPPEVGA